MGKEYLSEAAVFTCPLNMRFKATEMANTKVKYKGNKLLTMAAVFFPNQAPIPCSLLPSPGGPIPCPCIVHLVTGFVRHRAHMNLLTQDAKAICAAGKNVTPQKSGTNNHVLYGTAHSANESVIRFPTEADAAGNEQQPKAQASTKENAAPENRYEKYCGK